MSDSSPTGLSSTAELKSKLVNETARIRWHELQRYYAKGQVVAVSPELDLVEVAAHLAQDDRPRFEGWLAAKQIHAPSPDQARLWFEQDAELWAVVVAPWVLVQERDRE